MSEAARQMAIADRAKIAETISVMEIAALGQELYKAWREAKPDDLILRSLDVTQRTLVTMILNQHEQTALLRAIVANQAEGGVPACPSSPGDDPEGWIKVESPEHLDEFLSEFFSGSQPSSRDGGSTVGTRAGSNHD